jgi:hypothetical protein
LQASSLDLIQEASDDVFDAQAYPSPLYNISNRSSPLACRLPATTSPGSFTQESLSERLDTSNPVDLIMNQYAEDALTNTAQISQHKVQGPRLQPPEPIRDSVIKLRRMNSEFLPTFRADRRYFRLGREASPTPPGECDSPTLFAWTQPSGSDHLSDGEQSTLNILPRELNSPPDTWSATEHSARQGINTAANIKSNATTVQNKGTTPVQRASSVWEDGEKFWQPSHYPHNEEEKENMEVCPQQQSKRRSHMRKSAILNAAMIINAEKQPSEVAPEGRARRQETLYSRSPESLYDQHGFLKNV